MKHSDQGITRTQHGEEQPTDKDRAQTVHKTGEVRADSPRQETRKKLKTAATRSGHSTKND